MATPATIEVTLTVEGASEFFAGAEDHALDTTWDGEAVTARRTRRDRAYDLLRDAGDKGVSLLEFHLGDVPTPAVHCESLQFEGHAITSRVERTGRGGMERRWYMVKDAWA